MHLKDNFFGFQWCFGFFKNQYIQSVIRKHKKQSNRKQKIQENYLYSSFQRINQNEQRHSSCQYLYHIQISLEESILIYQYIFSLVQYSVIIHIGSRNTVGFACTVQRRERESKQDNENLGNVSKEWASDSSE